jgi:hypothetical protein
MRLYPVESVSREVPRTPKTFGTCSPGLRPGLFAFLGVDVTDSRPVTLCCWLCGDRIETTAHQAWGSAIDHALDHHPDYLRVDPDRVWDALTVSPSAPPLLGRAAAHHIPVRDARP